jgi:hypothetical protein
MPEYRARQIEFNPDNHFTFDNWVKPKIMRLKKLPKPMSSRKNLRIQADRWVEECEYLRDVWYNATLEDRLCYHIDLHYNHCAFDHLNGETEWSAYPTLREARRLLFAGKTMESLACLYEEYIKDPIIFPLNLEDGRWDDIVFESIWLAYDC